MHKCLSLPWKALTSDGSSAEEGTVQWHFQGGESLKAVLREGTWPISIVHRIIINVEK